MPGPLGTIDAVAALPLERALERTGVGLAACDAHGRLTLLSPVLQKLFGTRFLPVSEEDYPRLFTLLTADGVPMPVRDYPLTRARHGEYVRDELVSTQRRDGRVVHLRCNAAPVRDEEGAPAGALVLVQDVTDEREAEQATKAMRRAVVEAVNHEFRTPLASLLGHIELLQAHREGLPTEVLDSLDAIERAGWRLRDLVRGVTELIDGAATRDGL